MVLGRVTVQLLAVEASTRAFSPTYWIYMGATAIVVLAAARILALPPAWLYWSRPASRLRAGLRALGVGTWWARSWWSSAVATQ